MEEVFRSLRGPEYHFAYSLIDSIDVVIRELMIRIECISSAFNAGVVSTNIARQ